MGRAYEWCKQWARSDWRCPRGRRQQAFARPICTAVLTPYEAVWRSMSGGWRQGCAILGLTARMLSCTQFVNGWRSNGLKIGLPVTLISETRLRGIDGMEEDVELLSREDCERWGSDSRVETKGVSLAANRAKCRFRNGLTAPQTGSAADREVQRQANSTRDYICVRMGYLIERTICRWVQPVEQVLRWCRSRFLDGALHIVPSPTTALR